MPGHLHAGTVSFVIGHHHNEPSKSDWRVIPSNSIDSVRLLTPMGGRAVRFWLDYLEDVKAETDV